MFKWLKPTDASEGMQKMTAQLCEMIGHGRHVFDAAANAFLGAADPKLIREDLWATDKKINHLERNIRREAVVHGSVYGSSQLPTCLVLMSIVKDAERIGDYAKNLYEVAVVSQKRDDEYKQDLLEHKSRVSELMQEAIGIYGEQDEEKAKAFLTRGDAMTDHYDEQVNRLLSDDPGTDQPAPTALAYRYYKRVVSHLLNIITSLVMPVDKLDYFDEDHAGRE